MPHRLTNEDLAEMIRHLSEKTDARLTSMEADMRKMASIRDSAETLMAVADTWKLASLGGRIVKWLATLAAGVGALWLFVKDGPR